MKLTHNNSTLPGYLDSSDPAALAFASPGLRYITQAQQLLCDLSLRNKRVRVSERLGSILGQV